MKIDVTVRFTVEVPDGTDTNDVYAIPGGIEFVNHADRVLAEGYKEYETVSCVRTHAEEIEETE